MTAYASLRTKKQKLGGLGGSCGHNQRTIEVKHRDPEGKFERLVGRPGDTLKFTVLAREKKMAIKPKSNNVRTVEIVLSASPKYFRPNEPERWGHYDEERMQKWKTATMNWLKKRYGDNLITLDLHLDEATPHMHAMVTPITEKEMKKRRTNVQIEADEPAETYKKITLDAKLMFNRGQLKALQTEYANSIKHLGIERGIPGSKAKHRDVKKYYQEVNGPLPKIPRRLPVIVPTPKPPIFKKAEWAENYRRDAQKTLDGTVKFWRNAMAKAIRLIRHYKEKAKQSDLRSWGYWNKYGSPEKLDEFIEEKEKAVNSMKKELTEAKKTGVRVVNKKTEQWGAERDLLIKRADGVEFDLIHAKNANQKLTKQVSDLTEENKHLKLDVRDLKYKFSPRAAPGI